MILPMSPGTIDVVDRSGTVVGHGFVWIDEKEVRQEWMFLPGYEWPPFGVAEFRPGARAYAGPDEWRVACSDLWRDGCTFVRAVVERQDEIYPIPPLIGFCAVVCDTQLVGIAFAETYTKLGKTHESKDASGALAKQHPESAAAAAPVLFEARETWLTSGAFRAPPAAVVRVAPYSIDLFGPSGATRAQILNDFSTSGRYTRTVVYCTAYTAIPG